LGVLVDATEEHLFVHIFEGEVERLSGEITDDVGEVAPPKAYETLFLGDADETVHNT
jgi:hypothetical protein